jgi:hypothetical protein
VRAGYILMSPFLSEGIEICHNCILIRCVTCMITDGGATTKY